MWNDLKKSASSALGGLKKGAEAIGKTALEGYDVVSKVQQDYVSPAVKGAGVALGPAGAPLVGAAMLSDSLWGAYDAAREGKNPIESVKKDAQNIVKGVQSVAGAFKGAAR